MTSAIIAVIGTLAGGVTAGWFQLRQTRVNHAAAAVERRRTDRVAAAVDLGAALADHRRAMWQMQDAVLTGAVPERVETLRDETHRTRSRVTTPAVRLQLEWHEPKVRDAADNATAATYQIRDAADLDDLERRRRRAVELHEHFVAVARDFLVLARTAR